MRLSKPDQKVIVDSVKMFFPDDVKVWLFGSRVDDNKRGGDIDLYLEGTGIEQPLKKRILLKIALQDQLGEQKIDLVFHDMTLPMQPIHEIAKSEGVLLG